MNLLSNTTIWWRDIYYLLHREQLHVSALGNGHLQVVYEYLVSGYMGLKGGKLGTISRICPKDWMVSVQCGGPCCYQATSKLIMDKSMVGIMLCLSVLRNYPKV